MADDQNTENIIADRNVKAWGPENQKKLSESRALVLGSDMLAQIVLGGLAGLNIGDILVMDNAKYNKNDISCLVSEKYQDSRKVKHIEQVLKKINTNQDIKINSKYSKFCEAKFLSQNPDIIIDATNDPVSKEKCLRYLNKGSDKKLFISISSDDTRGSISIFVKDPEKNIMDKNNLDFNLENLLMEDYKGKKQPAHTSGVVAGIALEEIRKFKFAYSARDKQFPNNHRWDYNIFAPNRLGKKILNQIQSDIKYNKVLMVGAGGIGNFVGLSLAGLGIKNIDVLDFDRIEPTNLNRQILLYDKLNFYKADVLAERMKLINPKINVKSLIKKIGKIDLNSDIDWLKACYENDKMRWENADPDKRDKVFYSWNTYLKSRYALTTNEKNAGITLFDPEQLKNYSAVIGGLDNKYARSFLNHYCKKYGIIYLDGGTGYKSGQMSVYVPGKTKCLNCQYTISDIAPPRSCRDVKEGSVVMSNLIVGSGLVSELIHALDPMGSPLTNLIKYDVKSENRLYMRSPKNRSCDC